MCTFQDNFESKAEIVKQSQEFGTCPMTMGTVTALLISKLALFDPQASHAQGTQKSHDQEQLIRQMEIRNKLTFVWKYHQVTLVDFQNWVCLQRTFH